MSKDQMTPEEEFAAAFSEAAGSSAAEQEPAATAAASSEAAEGEKAPAIEPAGKVEPAAAPAEPVAQPAEKSIEVQLAEAKQQLAELQHRERSASGRVSEFHRKFNESQQLIEKLRGDLAAVKQPQAAAPSKEDEELAAALKEMPELGQVVDRLVTKRVNESVGAVQKQVQQVEQGMQPLRERAEQDAVRQELAVVETEFPQWREVVYGDEFKQWINGKPPAIREAYDRASTGQDALEFLRMYDREMGKTAAAPAPAPAAAPAASPKASQLARAVGVPTRSVAAPVTGMPDQNDFESSFDFFSKRRQTA